MLFIEHIDIEGPGTAGDFFLKAGLDVKTLKVHHGDLFPKDLSQVDAVVILGGPMNVYEEEKYLFLREEDVFIKRVMARGIPLLGICLGAQLIAKAYGARIEKSPAKEIGWSNISLTEEGKKDLLFDGVNDSLEVFQWHEDTFSIPEGGVLLATSLLCPHQAFKIGKCTYGFQFHIELTDNDIESWVKEYFKVKDVRTDRRGKDMLDRYHVLKEDFIRQSRIIYGNFLRIGQTVRC